MSQIIEVSENDILALDDRQLVRLMNHLIEYEAYRYNIPPVAIHTNEATNVPDDGIDARVEHDVETPSKCWIPSGLSVWQFKSGKTKMGIPKIIREANKEGVITAIKRSGSYCFVASQNYSDSERNKRLDALRAEYKRHNQSSEPKVNFLTASDISRWVNEYIGLALDFNLSFRHDDLFGYQNWATSPRLGSNIEFQIDDIRRDIIANITQITTTHKQICVQVIGADGVGKTRLVFEAIKQNGLGAFTVYAANPEAISEVFFSFISSRPNITRMILVVDECELEDVTKLRARASRYDRELTLILIRTFVEPEELQNDGTSITLSLPELKISAVQNIIKQICPGSRDEIATYIAYLASGCVKLAVVMAETVAHRPQLTSIIDITNSKQVNTILNLTIPDENFDERSVAQLLSLFRFVGIDAEVATHGECLAKFLDMSFHKFKFITEQLQKRGVVTKRGRFRIVTPTILAQYLAMEAWKFHNKKIIDVLYEKLSPALQNLLLQRLSELGNHQVATFLIEKWFGYDGQYASLKYLDDNSIGYRFALLSHAARLNAIRILENLVQNSSEETIISCDTALRSVVEPVISNLLHFEDTFWSAARLLRRLAEIPKSQSWDTNLIDLWRKIFYTHLGTGIVSLKEKLVLIEEALNSSNPKTRLVGVHGIAGVFHVLESRYVISNIGGTIVPEQWYPNTVDDIKPAHKLALRYLSEALNDHDENVLYLAQNIVPNAVWNLWNNRFHDDVILFLEDQLKTADTDNQKKYLRKTLQSILGHQATTSNEKYKLQIEAWLQSLKGTTIQAQLHRWIGQRTDEDNRKIMLGEINIKEVFYNISMEIMHQSELMPSEFFWLREQAPQYLKEFGFALGCVDIQFRLSDWLLQTSVQGNLEYLLIGYLEGHVEEGNTEWVSDILEQLKLSKRGLMLSIISSTIYMGYSKERMKSLRQIVIEDNSQINILTRQIYPWSDQLTVQDMKFIIQYHIKENKDNLSFEYTVLGLIDMWLEKHRQAANLLLENVFTLLDRIVNKQVRSNVSRLYDNRLGSYFERILDNFVTKTPERVAKWLMKSAFESGGANFYEIWFASCVHKVISSSPEKSWDIIGDSLLSTNMRINVGIVNNFVLETAISPQQLIAWAQIRGGKAASIVAGFVSFEDDTLSELTRQLLINFDDVEIGDLLSRYYSRGSWSGSKTNWLRGKLDKAKQWAKDEHPFVRKWAKRQIEAINLEIANYEEKEDEDSILLW